MCVWLLGGARQAGRGLSADASRGMNGSGSPVA